jgi:hypothetical protein
MILIRIRPSFPGSFGAARARRITEPVGFLLVIVALGMALGPAPVRAAGLVISIDNVMGPTAGAGTFEVLLTNTELLGGSSFGVASFTFELSVPSGTGVQFTDATTATVGAPYLFEGTGGASVDPGFTLSLDSFPNTGFIGSDTEFTFPSITVDPAQTFSLGLISYAVAANALPGNVPISFVAAGTSLADASGGPIPFNTDSRNGVIPVPEPSSLVLALIGLGTSLLGARLRL